jgi:ligand-binding sensor domain-containing protein/signal transduction histidine kinase
MVFARRRRGSVASAGIAGPLARVARLLGLLLPLLCLPGAGRADQGRWFALHTWGARHGLPENAIRALLQGRDGYLWIATHAGVARFDGIRFTVFDDRHHGPLKEIEIQALAEGQDGSLWIGSFGGGVTRLQGGRFTTFTRAQGLADDFVVALAVDREGGLWASTETGVSHWKDGRWRTYTVADGLPRNQTHMLYADPDGGMWIATRNGGLTRFHQGQFKAQEIPGLASNVPVRSMLRDRKGVLWVGSHGGLYRLDGGQPRRFGVSDGLAAERIHALAEDGEGNLWIASDNGISRHRDGNIETQVLPEYAGRGFTALAASREGGVWAGSGWLAYVRPRQFQNYAVKDGFLHAMPTTFFQDRDRTLWIGTVRGLASFRDGKFSAQTPEQGLPLRVVGGIEQDRGGHLWVGTDDGIYRSRAPLGAGIPTFTRVENQPTPTIQARVMYVDPAGVLWIGSVGEGLVRYADGAFTVYTTKDGLLHNAVRGIQQDRDGALWMGTRAGLNRFKDGKWTGFTTADGLAHDTVESLYLGSDGALWIGTRRGVNRRKDGRFSTFTVDQGLLASYVNSFAEDDKGHLWMVSIRGAFRADQRQLDAVAEGKLPAVSGAAFGVEDGMVSVRATAGYDRAVYKTADGRIWVATNQGAAVADPRALHVASNPPSVLIEEVQVDRRVLGRSGSLTAAPGRGDLQIQYTGLSFIAPEKVLFRYQLEGYDQGWVDAEHRRSAFYNNLPPGTYRFLVQAANRDGVWNTSPASVSLQLRPHWWRSWLFQAGALLAAVLLAAGLYRNHLRRLRTRQRQLEQAVAERTAELAAANKELETFSYSVSHDLRAPLRSIEGFGRALLEGHAATLAPEGRMFVTQIRQASERMDRLIDDILRLARAARTGMVRQAVDLSALASDIAGALAHEQPHRQVEVRITPGLMASADRSLMRIALENLIGNAWKFTSKRPAARIEVGLAPANGVPTFFVRDNGAGFDPAYVGKLFNAFQRLHGPSEFEGSGVGLATVRRIIQRHGGTVWAESGPDQGATFYFTVPDDRAA